MEPKVEMLKPKKLIGMHMEMSLLNNKTGELWQKFMRRRAEVRNRASSDYISMQKYGDIEAFTPETLFEKWAAVEVSSFTVVPSGMETYLLQGGKYAIFQHRGPADTVGETMGYIFEEWLPKSTYQVDSREHFEILPAEYVPVDPEASEEIWIPIKD